MTGRDAFLCGLLNCGPDDLAMLDRIELDWSDVMDEFIGWESEKIAGLDLNDLVRAAVHVGVANIETAVNDRICEMEAIGNERDLESDEEQELERLRTLEPREDIRSYHNYLDTHVWFEQNGEIYRELLPNALEAFYQDTGLEIAV